MAQGGQLLQRSIMSGFWGATVVATIAGTEGATAERAPATAPPVAASAR